MRSHTDALIMLDLDGTVIDTSELYFQGVPLIVQRHLGIAIDGTDILPMWGQLAVNFFRHFAQRAGNTDPKLVETMYADFTTYYLEAHNRLTTVYDGVETNLDAIHEAVHALGVVTTRPRSRSAPVLEMDWTKHMDFWVWGDQVPRNKPFPGRSRGRHGRPCRRWRGLRLCGRQPPRYGRRQARRPAGRQCGGIVGHHGSQRLAGRQTGSGLCHLCRFCSLGDPRMIFESISIALMGMLFGFGFLAGFVDSIAGGGGLISLPVLLSAGLPPQVALGTNKLQGSFGAFSAAYNYMRRDRKPVRQWLPGVGATFLGALIGAWAIQQLDPTFLTHLIPLLLFIVLIYILLSPRLGLEARTAIMSPGVFFAVFGVVLGFYDGFFGPGTGSFWTAALLMFLGLEMTQATGYTKVMNFTSNIVALGMFLSGGNVHLSMGLTMAAGQFLGARIGSGLAIRNGARFIRPFFLVVVLITLIRMVYVTYFAS